MRAGADMRQTSRHNYFSLSYSFEKSLQVQFWKREREFLSPSSPHNVHIAPRSRCTTALNSTESSRGAAHATALPTIRCDVARMSMQMRSRAVRTNVTPSSLAPTNKKWMLPLPAIRVSAHDAAAAAIRNDAPSTRIARDDRQNRCQAQTETSCATMSCGDDRECHGASPPNGQNRETVHESSGARCTFRCTTRL
jgi:hypothetical protein